MLPQRHTVFIIYIVIGALTVSLQRRFRFGKQMHQGPLSKAFCVVILFELSTFIFLIED